MTLPSSSHYTPSDNGKVLTISSLNHTVDDSYYSCAATNNAGVGNFNATFHLQINYPPTTEVIHTKSWTPTEENAVTLTCDITDGRPRSDIKKVTWKKGDITLPTSGRFTLSDNDKVLEISSLNHTVDDGHYSCAAHNEARMGDFSVKLHLLVNFKPSVSVETLGPVVEGESKTIRCHSQGARPAVTSVTWKKGQEVINVTTDSKYSGGTVETPSLTTGSVLKTDAGEYTSTGQ
ncbi:hypothetical protein NP493_754g01006 [Ridgeia piscesae]|uniref:Ig-like domain-containing protein n=1 Tax=Ridgeia piscesae TaxID=27915 RepID=A0AAD9NLW2_RIDPI|nr:hypothetical protein NP493_754g01006 [Ridgeia piscesae]